MSSEPAYARNGAIVLWQLVAQSGMAPLAITGRFTAPEMPACGFHCCTMHQPPPCVIASGSTCVTVEAVAGSLLQLLCLPWAASQRDSLQVMVHDSSALCARSHRLLGQR